MNLGKGRERGHEVRPLGMHRRAVRLEMLRDGRERPVFTAQSKYGPPSAEVRVLDGVQDRDGLRVLPVGFGCDGGVTTVAQPQQRLRLRKSGLYGCTNRARAEEMMVRRWLQQLGRRCDALAIFAAQLGDRGVMV